MNHYKVVLELEVDADNSLEAAKVAEKIAKSSESFTYVVQNDDTEQLTTVDLTESDEDAVLPLDYYEPLIS